MSDTMMSNVSSAIAADQLSGEVLPAEGKNPGEFDRLVRRHQKQAYNIAYRMTGNHADAEDLTQEAFVRAYRFFGNYRKDWPFDNWLYKIMSNLFIDNLRRKPKVKAQSLDQPIEFGDKSDEMTWEIPDSSSNPERVVLSEELDDYIQGALDSLPADFRMTVIYADIEGMSYEEISTAMACSLGTVRSRLHRGRKLLRSKIVAFKREAEKEEAKRDQWIKAGLRGEALLRKLSLVRGVGKQ